MGEAKRRSLLPARPVKELGRLAMREEGQNWNAYYTVRESMEGAVYLGSLNMRFARSPERRKQFLDLMRVAMADLIEELIGVRPVWGSELSAPESERASWPGAGS